MWHVQLGVTICRAGPNKTCSALKNKFKHETIKWSSSEKKYYVWLQDHGAAPLLGQQQRHLSYDPASTCEKDAGYFLEVSYLLRKPYDSLPFLYVSMYTVVLAYLVTTEIIPPHPQVYFWDGNLGGYISFLLLLAWNGLSQIWHFNPACEWGFWGGGKGRGLVSFFKPVDLMKLMIPYVSKDCSDSRIFIIWQLEKQS